MRLLQVSLRTLLLYSLALVLVSIPLSFLVIREILNEEVDESLALHRDQFMKHIKTFEYLDDLEMDLEIWDELSYDVEVEPLASAGIGSFYKTIYLKDALEQENHPFRILSSNVEIKRKPYLLTVRMSLVDNNQLVMALAVGQAVLIVLLAAGLLLINRSLSRRLWKPFYKTLNQLKAYELDKSEAFAPETANVIEFDDLNKTVSHLIDRNRRAYVQQKEFIENASHELQTPLAIFQAKLDILMQSPSMNEHEAASIMELEATAQRMARLNKNLLLLSKIDNDQFTELEDVSISTMASTILLTNLKPLADLDGIAIEAFISPLTVTANKTLIEVLLTNLFHNAIRHTNSGGKVTLDIKDRTLTITNTGHPLKMSPDKIFERFSKESKNEKSTGLGLAIVKKICDTCHYEIRYQFTKGVHSFVVLF